MESIIRADIFFFITTIAIVLFSIGFIIVFIYIVKILRDVQHISKKVREESDRIITDVEIIRNNVKAEGLHLSSITKFFGGMFSRRRTKKK